MAEEGKPFSASSSIVKDVKIDFPYMKKLIQFSSAINMWPRTKNRNFCLYHIVVLLVTINCIVFFLTYFIQIVKQYNNMDSVTALIDFATVFVSGTFRYIYIYVRGEKYKELISLIDNNFIHYSFFPKKNRACLMKYYKLANRIILTYSTFTLFWILQISFLPLFTYAWARSKETFGVNETEVSQIPYPVPMKVYWPFDYYEQPHNAIFYIFQSYGFVLFGYIYVVVDSFWYMVILLTIGQLALIKDSIETIIERIQNKGTDVMDVTLLDKDETERVEKELKICIEHHKFIREFIFTVDNISNPNILIDSLHAVISIGFILLDVTIGLNSGDWRKVLYSLEYLTTSIVHMFCFDWMSNELAVKEEELAEVIYDLPWYRCPKLKLEVMLVAIQSRRPYKLTGGKMYKLSLEFFAATIKAVFSYFTFLFQLRNS